MPIDRHPALGANTLPEEDTSQVQSLIQTWTDDLVTGRIAEWESLWAEEAVLMPPGNERVSGRSNIADYVTQAFGSGISYRFTDWSFTGRDDLAVVTNQIELNAEENDGKASSAFNQMIVLRRGTDLSWRIQAVMFTPVN